MRQRGVSAGKRAPWMGYSTLDELGGSAPLDELGGCVSKKKTQNKSKTKKRGNRAMGLVAAVTATAGSIEVRRNMCVG